MFRDGETYETLRKRVFMREQDYEQLTLFPEDSRASRSVLPGSEEARRMTVTSGLKCLELYRNSGPLGSLARMLLASSIWHSTKCFLTWKTKVTKANALLFQLAVSMPHTNDTESQFWPTLLANGLGSTGHQMMLQRMVDIGILSKEERRAMIMGNGGKINPGWAEWLMGYMQQFTKLLPTPTSTDYRGGSLGRYWMPKNPSESLQKIHVERERERTGMSRHRYDSLLRSLECSPRGRIGYLNPEWIEWLMGFPIGWTELDA